MKPTDRVPLPYPQERPLDTVQVGDHTPEPKRSTGEGWVCRCHERMGNDFYFLPHDRCLYDHCDREERCALAASTALHEEIEQRHPRAAEGVITAPVPLTWPRFEPKPWTGPRPRDTDQLAVYASALLGAQVHKKVAEVTVRGMALFNQEVKQALDEIERYTDPTLDIERDLA